MAPTERWIVVEETCCPDGNNDAVIRAFKASHREYTAEPDRLRIEMICMRSGTGQSTVRFLWNEVAPERSTKRKPRHPKSR